MKLRSHLLCIGIIFLLVIGLFGALFSWGYLSNKRWNDGSNTTKCQISDTEIVKVSCSIPGPWPGIALHNIYPSNFWDTSGRNSQDSSQNRPKCYDGIAVVRYINVSHNFTVEHGSFSQVNQTLTLSYPKNGYIDCVVQINDPSDFRLQRKPETYPLTIYIICPGIVILFLFVWGIIVVLSKRKHRNVERLL